MALWKPDPTFYPSPRLAAQAPAERLAYVAAIGLDGRPDSMQVLDLDPASATYGTIVGRVDMPNVGDELHHFGWNACSSALCPYAPHPHVERRYLVVPGLALLADPHRRHQAGQRPRAEDRASVIEPEEIAHRTGYTRRTRCTADPTASTSARSARRTATVRAASSCSITTPSTCSGAGRVDRGPQKLAYDFWWHLGYDTLITSEWGTPNMVENGVHAGTAARRQVRPPPARLGPAQAPPRADARSRRRAPDGARAAARARSRRKPYGFVGVVVSLKDLSASIWMWYRRRRAAGRSRRSSTIPAEPADPDQLPPLLQPFKAVPPLITDINLSLDDKFLYVSCWGTGELQPVRRLAIRSTRS